MKDAFIQMMAIGRRLWRPWSANEAERRSAEFVAMAAYGDYGPGYIGTEIAYGQGGYETGPVSRVAPRVERILMEAMETLLDVE